jgi:hypothetical protein
MSLSYSTALTQAPKTSAAVVQKPQAAAPVRKVVYPEVATTVRPYKASSADFQVWLDQPVWVTDSEKATRRDYIPAFADAITEWMRSIGYTMDGRWGKGHLVIARWMYAIHINEIARANYGATLAYPEIQHRDWPEDRETFGLYVNYDEVYDFMEGWKLIEDLDSEFRWGQRVYGELETLLYHYIDLENSRIGIQLANKICGSDSDSDSGSSRGRRRRGKVDDVYLREASEGFHGGRGSKV